MCLIVSDLEGTLTTGASWLGIRAYLRSNRKRWAYDRFLLGWLPRYLLVKIGLLERKKVMESWMLGEINLLLGETTQAIDDMAEWVVANRMWVERRVDVLDQICAQRQSGAQLAIVSSGYQPIVEAFAQRINDDTVAIGSELIYQQDKLVGLANLTNSYEQKAENIRAAFQDRRIIAAYGDTLSDLPMLEMSENPIAVYPDAGLRKLAESRGWQMIDENHV